MKDPNPGQQIPLPVGLDVESTFDNYYLPEQSLNLSVLHGLYGMVVNTQSTDTAALIWGDKSVGLSHLLKACASHSQRLGQSSHYISLGLNSVDQVMPEHLIERAAGVQLLCLDDIDAVVGNRDWEVALFTVFNQLKDAGNRVVFASHTAPQILEFELADLRSRVLSGPVFQLQALNDEEKIGALQLQAYRLGMNMPVEVATYIVNHSERDLGFLFDLLNRLDQETLAQKRKLTVPFVKQVLGAK